MLSIFLASIGIMSAMPEEGHLICDAMQEKKVVHVGNREFIQGAFEGGNNSYPNREISSK